MPSAQLQAVHLRNLEPGKVYFDGAGLRLKVKANGNAFWVFRYTRKGVTHDMGLGPLRDVSLANAREQARRLRETLRTGGDPWTQRAQARAHTVPTFRECAERMMETKRHEWRNAKHAGHWASTLKTYAMPVLGGLPVDAVETEHVLKVLEPIWTRKTETATRVRQRIEAVLDWARARRYRLGENPARWRGHLDKLLAKPTRIRTVRHHPALPYAELPEFMAALSEQKGIAARALAFTILTAARSGEVRGATWEEIYGNVWTVPGERMKAHREHRVPLSRLACGMINAVPRFEAARYVFPGQNLRKPISNGAMSAVLKRMGHPDLTVHGFRSTFRDWCAEQTNFPRELAEAALAHVIRDKTEAAYQRGDLLDRRRKMMEAWAKQCWPMNRAGVVELKRRAS